MPHPSVCGWQKVADKWFSELTVRACPDVLHAVLPALPGDQDIWTYLPIRGIRFLSSAAKDKKALIEGELTVDSTDDDESVDNESLDIDCQDIDSDDMDSDEMESEDVDSENMAGDEDMDCFETDCDYDEYEAAGDGLLALFPKLRVLIVNNLLSDFFSAHNPESDFLATSHLSVLDFHSQLLPQRR
jgi:hypothetical protein